MCAGSLLLLFVGELQNAREQSEHFVFVAALEVRQPHFDHNATVHQIVIRRKALRSTSKSDKK